MEGSGDKDDDLLRLALCVGAALALYRAARPLCEALKLPQADHWLTWLEEHRTVAIALTAALLYLITLILHPTSGEHKTPPDGFVPCEGPDA